MYRTLLRRRPFLLLWIAQICSTLAIELFDVAVMVVIFEQTGSALQAAGVLVARTLPHVVLGPMAGALVDRYPRQRVLLCMELVRGALLVSAALFVAETAPIWSFYALVAGLTAAQVFYRPAQMSLIPSLAARQEIVHANSLINSTNYATLAIGAAVGGLMIIHLGLHVILLVDLVLLAAAALSALSIRVPRRAQGAPDKEARVGFARSIADGIAYLREHRLARALLTMEFLEHWSHGLWSAALMLAFTLNALEVSEEWWGYQSALYFGGSLLGATLAITFAARLGRHPGWVVIINAFLMAALTLAYSLSQSIWITLLLCVMFGPPMALRDVAQDSLLQSTVEDGMLGRVYATRQTLAMSSFMLSGLGLAYLADVIPVRQVYLIGAALYFLTALYALSRRSLRRAQLQTAALAHAPAPLAASVVEPLGD